VAVSQDNPLLELLIVAFRVDAAELITTLDEAFDEALR